MHSLEDRKETGRRRSVGSLLLIWYPLPNHLLFLKYPIFGSLLKYFWPLAFYFLLCYFFSHLSVSFLCNIFFSVLCTILLVLSLSNSFLWDVSLGTIPSGVNPTSLSNVRGFSRSFCSYLENGFEKAQLISPHSTRKLWLPSWFRLGCFLVSPLSLLFICSSLLSGAVCWHARQTIYHWALSPTLILLFKIGSHKASLGSFELTLQPKQTLNWWSTCSSFTNIYYKLAPSSFSPLIFTLSLLICLQLTEKLMQESKMEII